MADEQGKGGKSFCILETNLNNALWEVRVDCHQRVQRPVSRKSRKLFGPEKPFLKLRPAYSVKLVFSYVVKGIKSKIITKFCTSRRLRFEDTKRIMSPEMCPKSSGTFEKQAPGFIVTTEFIFVGSVKTRVVRFL